MGAASYGISFRERGHTIVEFTAQLAGAAAELPHHDLHKDPFDRALIATAFSLDAVVLTDDAKFGLYKGLITIW